MNDRDFYLFLYLLLRFLFFRLINKSDSRSSAEVYILGLLHRHQQHHRICLFLVTIRETVGDFIIARCGGVHLSICLDQTYQVFAFFVGGGSYIGERFEGIADLEGHGLFFEKDQRLGSGDRKGDRLRNFVIKMICHSEGDLHFGCGVVGHFVAAFDGVCDIFAVSVICT